MSENEVEVKTVKSRRKMIWQFAYIIGTLALLVGLGYSDPDLLNLFTGEITVDSFWMIMCGVGMVTFWGMQACVYALTGNIVECKVSFWTSVRIAMFGEYYSAITPLGTGGQPMLIAYYRRYNVSTAKATSILAMRYIGYVSSISIYYIISLIAHGGWILETQPFIFWLTAIGFVINFASVVGIIMILASESLVRRLGLWAINLVTKLSFLKKRKERWTASFMHGVEEFTAAAENIRIHPFKCVLGLLLSLISVAGELSVAYFVYRAMGFSAEPYSLLFAMQTFLYLAVTFVPTPGGTGATEGGFYVFFATLFPKSLLYSAMLIWRAFTYYSQLALGAIFVLADEIRAVSKRKASLKAASTEASETVTEEAAPGAASSDTPATNATSPAPSADEESPE